MNKSPKIYLSHIIDASNDIETFISGYNQSQFDLDIKTQDAVIRKLEVIGEASNHLEEEFINLYPNIPWNQIVAFRNKLIHEYWDLDLKMIWRTATEDIPQLKNAILPILKTLE